MSNSNNIHDVFDGLKTINEGTILQELADVLGALQVYQEAAPKLFTPQELAEAQGRKCVLEISDTTPKYRLYFKVDGNGLKLTEAFGDYNTWISAPADSIIRVLKGVLEGDEDAFPREWAKGRTRILGQRSVHDGVVFGEMFGRLAKLIKRLKAARR